MLKLFGQQGFRRKIALHDMVPEHGKKTRVRIHDLARLQAFDNADMLPQELHMDCGSRRRGVCIPDHFSSGLTHMTALGTHTQCIYPKCSALTR